MGGVWMIARSEARRRLGGLVLLALLVAVTGGVVMAGVAGARRTASVLDRYLGATHARDTGVMVYPAPGLIEHDATRVPALAASLATVPGVQKVGTVQGYPAQMGTKFDFMFVSSPDGSAMADIDRPLLLEGRMPRSSAADEVALNAAAAEELGKHPGDTIRGTTFSPDAAAGFMGGTASTGPPEPGPDLTMRVVGLVRSPEELQGQQGGSSPMGFTSPAFAARHARDVGSTYALYSLRGHPSTTDVWTVANAGKGPQDKYFAQVETIGQGFANDTRSAHRTIAVGAVIFSVVAALATVLAVGQALARQIAASSDVDPVGRGLGLTRRQRTLALALPPGVAVVAGLATAVAISVVLSPLFPVSVARLAEPDPGIRLDPPATVASAVALLVVLVLLAVGVALRTVVRDRSRVAVRGEGLAGRLGHLGVRPPAAVGVDLAFDRRRGRNAVPARGALVGAMVAVAGIVAVAVFLSSVNGVRDDPARYGWTWDAKPDLSDTGHVTTGADPVMAAVRTASAEPGVASAGAVSTSTVSIDGKVLSAVALDVVSGSTHFTTTAGRPPSGPAEVALGRTTMADLGVHLGDRVQANAADGTVVPLTVTGEVVIPLIDSAKPAEGAALTQAAFDTLTGEDRHQAPVLTYRRGVDVSELERRLGADGMDFSVYSRPEPPGLVQQLDRMSGLLQGLALFLAALGTVGLLHFLAVSVRRRRNDVAVLRTIGFVRRQVREVVTWQAIGLTVVGVVVGVPAGIVVGRLAWGAVVSPLGVADGASVPVLVLVLLSLVVLVGAAVLSLGPAWFAVRRTPAQALRAE